MAENHPFEMLLCAAKETENKLRWDADIAGTTFSLYIPKWRVPLPWPSRIWVALDPADGNRDDGSGQVPPPNLETPIRVAVFRYEEKTETVRFRPAGASETWEIGEPYIPRALLRGDPQCLQVFVRWDTMPLAATPGCDATSNS